MLLLLGGFLNRTATARGAQVPVVVVPNSWLAATAHDGATGLYVPGAGATVTGADTVAALERGEVKNSVLGGRPGGRRRIRVRAGRATGRHLIYVVLPPPGRHRNTRRYGIAIFGPHYHGILTSASTRIPGLVSVADVAQTAEALAAGKEPLIRSRAGDDEDVARLDRRLARAHDLRTPALAAAAVLLAGLAVGAFLFRRPVIARAAVVFGAAAAAASLVASDAGGVTASIAVLAAASAAFVVAGAFALRPFVLAALVTLLFVLAIDTTINTFGPLGPHAESGGRFYGLTNLQETLLLAPVLVAAAGPWLVPVAALALVTVGWSHAGADGGGLVVFAIAFGVLAVRVRRRDLTPKRTVMVVAAALVAALALVGLDAALGGSSHVTRAVGSGSVFDHLWHRWQLSYAVVTSSWHKALLFLASLAALAWLALRRESGPVLEAFLAGIVVSLLVNDTPVDVAGFGALGGVAVVAWERTRPPIDSRPMSRRLLAFPLLVLALAGCGSEGTVRALPETVEGTVQAEAPGKAIFTQQGCNGCHTYKPANANGNIGPDLDKLAEFAKRAKQPLDKFTRESIVDPTAYTEKGYPKGAMPPFKLPEQDLNDLVDFLTKPAG